MAFRINCALTLSTLKQAVRCISNHRLAVLKHSMWFGDEFVGLAFSGYQRLIALRFIHDRAFDFLLA